MNSKSSSGCSRIPAACSSSAPSLLGGMIALGGGSYLYNPRGSWAADPIKVGIATDLTGPISWGGIPNANVAKMVIDDMNAKGGLLGRPLQMILEDTATNEALAVTRVRKLVTQDKVDVVFGGITSSMRNAIKDTIVNRGKTLYIYPQLYEGKECTPYLFCSGPTPAQQCDTFIPWLIKNGGKKFYLPSADYVWPHVLNEYARKSIEKNGGEVVGEEYFPVDHNDYGATVNKIMSNKVNVVFNTTIPPGVAAFFKQLYEAGFSKNGGRLACVYYDENALNITPAHEIEGLGELPGLLQGGQRPGRQQDPGGVQQAVPRAQSVHGGQRLHGHVSRAQAVGSRGEGSQERQAGGGRAGAGSRHDRRRPRRRQRIRPGHPPREDEHVHGGGQGRQVRDRGEEQGSGHARRMRVRGAPSIAS